MLELVWVFLAVFAGMGCGRGWLKEIIAFFAYQTRALAGIIMII